MTRKNSPVFDLINNIRGLGRAADAVARAAEDTAQARADGRCLVCGKNPAIPGADICGECRADAVDAGAGAAKSAIDTLADLLTGRR